MKKELPYIVKRRYTGGKAKQKPFNGDTPVKASVRQDTHIWRLFTG
ncbi:MAG: hypothetical protein OSJ61_26345 [Lachnospiraceae bacterium]|nr:hypothetical protein [Lachnospiraceae bacterium]